MNKTTVIIIAVAVILGGIFFLIPKKSQGINPRLATNVNNTNKCMITLFGKQYDVTQFRKIHQGGDVFVCGTDMTVQYQQQHGNDVSRIQRFLNL